MIDASILKRKRDGRYKIGKVEKIDEDEDESETVKEKPVEDEKSEDE